MTTRWSVPPFFAGKWWLLLLSGIFIAVIAAGRLAPTDAPAVEISVAEKPVPVVAGAGSTAQQRVAGQQKVAAAAVLHSSGAKALTGVVAQRPDFVSPLEWEVLQGVARQNDDPGKELTRLVNNLRFSKQEEQWRALAAASTASTDAAVRHALAWQLLDDIPARVTDRALDEAGARHLQQELLADVMADPQVRTQRATREAARLKTSLLQAVP